jgi:hypothetical protein
MGCIAWIFFDKEERVTMNRITGNEKSKSGENLLTRGLWILINWKVCLLVRKHMFGFRLVAIDDYCTETTLDHCHREGTYFKGEKLCDAKELTHSIETRNQIYWGVKHLSRQH